MNQKSANFTYKNAIVGGTFDHFHKGHELLLSNAFKKSAFVTIGIATEELYKNKYLSHSIQEYILRKSSVESYLLKNVLTKRSRIQQINDIYGSSLVDTSIDVIFANSENLNNIQLINQKRKEVGLTPLSIELIDDVLGIDGHKISSERIRGGQIDRQGMVYLRYFQNTLVLPQNLRAFLKKPLGQIVSENEFKSLSKTNQLVISVGDIVTLYMLNNNFIPDISIIDLKTRRSELQKNDYQKLMLTLKPMIHCDNPPGFIQKETVMQLSHCIQYFLSERIKQTLLISGEEDLLTLPAILLSPLNSIVYYGQYNTGIISVRVTEEKKQEISEIIKKFTQR